MTFDVLTAALVVLAAAFFTSGALVWALAGERMIGALLGLNAAFVLGAAVATADGQAPGRPLLVAGLIFFPLALALYPIPRILNPIDILALLAIALAGALGAIYQGDVSSVMGLVISSVLIAYIWWKIESSAEDQRLALFWLCFALVPPALMAGYESFVSPDSATGALTAVACLTVPAALVIGLVRPRVVDVRALIVSCSVNLSAGLVVVAIFVGVASYLETVRGHEPSIGTLGVLAAVCAGGFQASRVVLRGVIDQLLFGDRPDPLTAASHVGESMADDPVLALRAIREALALPYAALTVSGLEVASSGSPVTNTRSIALRLGQDTVGEIVIGLRAGELALNKQDESVLRIVAPALAQAVHARALADDLAESRGQAISAIADERRRLRRDLHDGLGPTLTGVAYAADAARNVMDKDPSAADALLAGLRTDTASAILEIRRLVEGLRPPALDQLGLVQAVKQRAAGMHTAAGKPLAITFETPDRLPEIPAAAEVAAYRIVLEALTNVARHSSASTATVEMAMADDWLSLIVSDNGKNPTDWQPGVGMSSMRERAEEVGGTLQVEAGKAGSRVAARLPVGAP